MIEPKDLPDFNLLTGGFPCPSFSIQGKREGFEDDRGKLFFDIIKIAKVKQPEYMILENVKGIVSHDNGRTLNRVLNELRKIGYDVAYKVLNSKDYGIPQNRERIWFVCKLGKWDFMEFMFPEKETLKLKVWDLLENDVSDKYNLTEKQIAFITDEKRQKKRYTQINGQVALCQTGRQYANWNGNFVADYRVDEGLRIRRDGCSPCLKEQLRPPQQDSPSNRIIIHSMQPRSEDRPSFKKAREEGKPYPGGYGHLKREDGLSYCLDTVVSQSLQVNERYRQLTPRECFRLMGFLNDEINIDGIADSKLYKLVGNGWDINLVSKIFKGLYRK